MMANPIFYSSNSTNREQQIPPWFWRGIRRNAEDYVKQMSEQGLGNFCIRIGTQPDTYALTTCNNGKAMHYVIRTMMEGNKEKYKLDVIQDPPWMDCLYDIVQYYSNVCQNSKPVASSRASLPPLPSPNSPPPLNYQQSIPFSQKPHPPLLNPFPSPIASTDAVLMSPVPTSPIGSIMKDDFGADYQNTPKQPLGLAVRRDSSPHNYLKPDSIRNVVEKAYAASKMKKQESLDLTTTNKNYVCMTANINRRGSHSLHDKRPYVNM